MSGGTEPVFGISAAGSYGTLLKVSRFPGATGFALLFPYYVYESTTQYMHSLPRLLLQPCKMLLFLPALDLLHKSNVLCTMLNMALWQG